MGLAAGRIHCGQSRKNLEVRGQDHGRYALGQSDEKDRMMDGKIKEKDRIREELTELLETYYNDSFVQLVCDYIRSTGMTQREVERVLEEMRKQKGA